MYLPLIAISLSYSDRPFVVSYLGRNNKLSSRLSLLQFIMLKNFFTREDLLQIEALISTHAYQLLTAASHRKRVLGAWSKIISSPHIIITRKKCNIVNSLVVFCRGRHLLTTPRMPLFWMCMILKNGILHTFTKILIKLITFIYFYLKFKLYIMQNRNMNKIASFEPNM